METMRATLRKSKAATKDDVTRLVYQEVPAHAHPVPSLHGSSWGGEGGPGRSDVLCEPPVPPPVHTSTPLPPAPSPLLDCVFPAPPLLRLNGSARTK
jgi:hypothetical protein